MAKQSGLGDRFYIGGVDASGDIQAVDNISGNQAVIDTTDITQSANSRLCGVRDGQMSFTTFFDTALVHPLLSALPAGDVHFMYCRGVGIGVPAASMVAKQLDYNGTRSATGEFTFKVEADANGDGLEWGVQLTAGMITIATAGNQTAVDGGAADAFGLQAYLQVAAFTGTDATVKLQDSTDNVTFADITGAAFAQITAASAPQAQRIAIANTATVRRYVRAAVVTTGGFTVLTFAVNWIDNDIAGTVF